LTYSQAGWRPSCLKNLWIDLPRYTIQADKRNLQTSEAGVYFVAMDVINQVQRAYYVLVFAWENLIVQEKLILREISDPAYTARLSYDRVYAARHAREFAEGTILDQHQIDFEFQ